MKKVYFTIILAIYAINGLAQAWPQTAKFRAADAQTDDNNGYSVAISGQYAITGAYHEDHDGTGGNQLTNAGSAYIFKYDTTNHSWVQEAKLVAADRSANANFGYSVDISGTYAVIGAVADSAASGAAYVFERSGAGVWTQVAKLVATSRRANDRFGVSVAIYGDTVIVGAHHEDEDTMDANTIQNAGSAYIYNRNGGSWDFFQKIVASDRSGNGVNDEFGISVDIHKDRIIVGAYRHDADTATQEKGAAYVFAFSGGSWTESKILQAADRYHDDEFGWSVGVSGRYYVVGAPRHDLDTAGSNGKNNPGAAYIFDETNSWAEAKVVASDRADQDNYGQSVSISGERAVIGAPLQNSGPIGQTPPAPKSDGGAAYVVKRNSNITWTEEKKLVTSDSDRFAGDKLGYSVCIDGATVIAGAPEDNIDSTAPEASAGAAYIFRRDTTTTVYVANVNTSNSLHVFPNPAREKITVQLPARPGVHNIRIYDTYGKCVSQNSFSQVHTADISIAGLPAGVYLIIAQNAENKILTTRVVKY